MTALISPEIQIGQFLFGSSAYSVQEFIGEGGFGKVAKCKNLITKEEVAVKILKQDSDSTMDMQNEVSILEEMSVFDPDRINVVKFFEQFEDMGQTCLVFEMLDMSLFDMIVEGDGCAMFLMDIRPIATQLLVALDALKSIGILHTDIKTDNIMLVHRQNQPYRVKLIDFGAAMMASEAEVGLVIQPIGYRAPEVTLGLPFNTAVDMWGLGCMLAFLYLANNLFPVTCEYQMIKSIVKILGLPESHLLENGLYTNLFFFCEKDGSWRLLTRKEYEAVNEIQSEKQRSSADLPSCLDDLIDFYPKEDAAEYDDRKVFVDLLKGLLHLEADKRISPEEALQHPFITLSHLVEHHHSTRYLTAARLVRGFLGPSADRVDSSAALPLGQRSASRAPTIIVDASSDGSLKQDGDTVSLVDVPKPDPSDEAQDFDSDHKDSDARSPGSPSERDVSDNDSIVTLRLSQENIYEEDSSDEEFTNNTNDEDLSVCSSDGDWSSLVTEYLDSLGSHRAPERDSVLSSCTTPSCSDSEESVYRSYDEETSTDSTPAASASSGRGRKILKRISKFFRRVAKTFCCCCCDVEE